MGHGSCFPRQNTFDRQLFSIGSTAESHFQPFLHARLSQSDKIDVNLGEADRPTKLSFTMVCHNYSIHASISLVDRTGAVYTAGVITRP